MKQFSAMLICAFTWAACTAAAGVTLRVEPERSVLPAGSSQETMIRIAVSAPVADPAARQAPKVNLAVALDCSGSMSGDKIIHARQAAKNALELLGENDTFSLILYNHTARVLIPATRVTASAKRELGTVIDSIPAGGGTALFAGVSLAADELRKLELVPGRIQRIILLSDGQANVGPSSPGELGKLGAALVKEGVSVSCVGIGSDYNEDLMTSLAQNSDGNFYFVTKSADLASILERELGSALSVAAQKVKIRITCPEGVTPRGILGYGCKVNGRSIELDFNQIYAGHDKVLLLQVELPPQPEGSAKPLADVKLEYLTNEAKQAPALTRSVAVNFSGSAAAVEQSLNKNVSADIALQQSAVIRAEAIREADAGNFDEGAKRLQDARQLLEQNAAATGRDEVKRSLELVSEDLGKLEKAKAAPAVYNETRKQIRGREYQQRNSQPVRQ